MTDVVQGVGPVPATSDNRSWITSFVLVLLTLLVAVTCIITLACTLTQTRVASLVVDVSIPKLDFVGRQWAVHRNDGKELIELEQEDLKLSADIAVASLLSGRASDAVQNKLDAFSFRTEKIPDFPKQTHPVKMAERYSLIVGNKDFLIQKDEGFRQLIDDIEKAFDDLSRAQATVARMGIESGRVKAKIELTRNRVEQAMSTVFNYIKADLDKDKDARARVENAFYELSIDKFDCGLRDNTECGPLGGLIARGLYHILTLRPDLLTLCLVILMGVLGSTLQISHAYFMKNERQDIGGYFQRIAVGAMTALVIFIVAKAGVPVVTDTSRLGGDAPINPYLISFLAIISGLLSENAIANIQAQGRRYLGDGGGVKRWARQDLTGDLPTQQVTIETLAGHLGVEKPMAESMLKGETAMDPPQQQTVALILRRDPRGLFTDIAPPIAAATP